MSFESVMPSNHLILCHFFLFLPSFPASGCFPVSRLFASGGQSIGASPSASALPLNIQDWSPLGLTGLISLLSKGLSRVFSKNRKHQFFGIQSYGPTLTSIHDYWEDFIALTIWTFFGKVMSLLFNMLARFVIAFLLFNMLSKFVIALLPSRNVFLISWLQSPFTVILEPKKIKSITVSMFYLLFAMKWWEQMPWS